MSGQSWEQAQRRVARALVDAEAGDEDIHLDDAAIRVLALDGEKLAATVPHAMGALAARLAAHTRAAVRLEAVRLLTLVMPIVSELTRRTLQRLATDRSNPVRSAAARALMELGPLEAWDDEPTVATFDGAPTIVEAPIARLPIRRAAP